MEIKIFIVNFVVTFILGIIWSNEGAKNIFVKILLISIALCNAFVVLNKLGYIIKI